MIISHHKSTTLSKLQWIQKIPCNFVIIKADPSLNSNYEYNKETNTCIVKAPDDYRGLPFKIQAGFKFIYEHFNPEFVFKIDNDVFVDLDKLLSLKMSHDYEGVITICNVYVYCGGPLYYVSKKALEVLQNMIIDMNGEDVSVGRTLSTHKICMKYTELYTDYLHDTGTSIAYHDHSRMFLK